MAKEIEGIMLPVNIYGDSAIRFSKNLMKPYPFSATSPPWEKTFNYHLLKCRRVVENAFGHLKARFRRLLKGIEMAPRHVLSMIKCACVLHNFLNVPFENADVFEQQNPEFLTIQ